MHVRACVCAARGHFYHLMRLQSTQTSDIMLLDTSEFCYFDIVFHKVV